MASKLEIWRAGGPNTGFSAAQAGALEAEGWDGQMFMDSQSLSADAYVLMGAWAQATRRLRLSTGVTNPLTRNLAVTAAGAATVHAMSGGRAVLGIGRGDSALAYLGLAPAPLAGFEAALTTLQALLSGHEVDFAATGERGRSRALEALSLGARPESAQLKWLPAGLSKVPLDVAATGPKVIAMAARIAERVTFSVGAEIERLEWALDLAAGARAAAGRAVGEVSCGAQLVVVCHSDPTVALEQAMIFAPPLARFQVMEGDAAGPGGQDASLGAVRAGYDMNKHSIIQEKNRLTHGALSPDFVRRFTIAGTPDHCTARLLELHRAGIERFVVVGPGFYPEEWGEAQGLFAREVIPALRAG